MSKNRTTLDAEHHPKAITASAIGPADLSSPSSGLPKEPPRGARRRPRSTGNEEDGASDSRVYLSSLRVLLVSFPGLFADGFARSLGGLADQVEVLRCHPERTADSWQDVGLMLVDVDRTDRADLIGALREQSAVPLVALTSALDDRSLTAILEAGATACLAKSCSEAQALTTLRRVLISADADARASDPADDARPTRPTSKRSVNRRGDQSSPYGLTPAELRVLSLLCEGLTNLAIAHRLEVSEGTVKVHLIRVYQKLGVHSRTQAVSIGERLDVIHDMQLESVADGGCLIEWLLPEIKHESRRKGELLFQKGDPADVLYYVQSGAVALCELGTEVRAGELLGEVGVFAPQRVRTSSARCTVDTRLFRLSAEQVKRLYFENPRLAYYLTRVIARRLTADRLSSREPTHRGFR
jgi:two-component system nitrate/nitrite response regulator NarL